VRRRTLVLVSAIALAAALVGCGSQSIGTLAPGDQATLEPEAEFSPTIEPAATAKPTSGPIFTYKGSSTRKSKAFTISLPARIDYTFSGSGNFIASIEMTDNSGSVGQIANIIGSAKATTWMYGDGLSGRVYVDVIADGSWTIKVTSNTSATAKKLPVSFSGKWGLTTVPFRASGDVVLKYTHRGSGNFIVGVIDASSGAQVDTVANEIGRVSAETNLYGLDGVYALDVIADGPWTVSISGG